MQLRERENQFESLGVVVLIVTFENQPIAEKYVQDTNLTWPLLLDRDRSVYHAYGMPRAGYNKLFGFAAMRVYLKLFFRGRKIKKPTDDVRQLGGDVLVDPKGVVQLQHVSDNPADRPTIERLLQAISENDP